MLFFVILFLVVFKIKFYSFQSFFTNSSPVCSSDWFFERRWLTYCWPALHFPQCCVPVLSLNFHNSFPSSFSNFLCFRLICGKTSADILLTSHGSTNEAWDSPTIFSHLKNKDHQQIFLQFRNFNQIWENMWSRCLKMDRIVWRRRTYSSNIVNFSVFKTRSMNLWRHECVNLFDILVYFDWFVLLFFFIIFFSLLLRTHPAHPPWLDLWRHKNVQS